jgi:hypothetical protein
METPEEAQNEAARKQESRMKILQDAQKEQARKHELRMNAQRDAELARKHEEEQKEAERKEADKQVLPEPKAQKRLEREQKLRELRQKNAERVEKAHERARKAQRELEESRAARLGDRYPRLRPEMICPHCQTRGTVTTARTNVKQGISGGKATGAILTGGLSLFATGLSRKQKMTSAKCSNCGAEWLF